MRWKKVHKNSVLIASVSYWSSYNLLNAVLRVTGVISQLYFFLLWCQFFCPIKKRTKRFQSPLWFIYGLHILKWELMSQIIIGIIDQIGITVTKAAFWTSSCIYCCCTFQATAYTEKDTFSGQQEGDWSRRMLTILLFRISWLFVSLRTPGPLSKSSSLPWQ